MFILVGHSESILSYTVEVEESGGLLCNELDVLVLVHCYSSLLSTKR